MLAAHDQCLSAECVNCVAEFLIACRRPSCAPLVADLLEAKISVDARGGSGRTPAHVACRADNAAVLKLLIDARANLERRDSNGNTPVNTACVYGATSSLRLLCAAGANIESHGSGSATPAQLACRFGDVAALKLLFAAGARLGARDIFGNTAAHYIYFSALTYCATYPYFDDAATCSSLLDVLAAAGVDLSALNRKLQSPLQNAHLGHHSHCASTISAHHRVAAVARFPGPVRCVSGVLGLPSAASLAIAGWL